MYTDPLHQINYFSIRVKILRPKFSLSELPKFTKSKPITQELWVLSQNSKQIEIYYPTRSVLQKILLVAGTISSENSNSQGGWGILFMIWCHFLSLEFTLFTKFIESIPPQWQLHRITVNYHSSDSCSSKINQVNTRYLGAWEIGETKEQAFYGQKAVIRKSSIVNILVARVKETLQPFRCLFCSIP